MKVVEVKSHNEQKKFVNFPYQLYKEHKYWVPPLKQDEYKIFHKHTNPALQYCEAAFWILVDNKEKVIGRVAGIINPLYNQKSGIKYARLSRFEVINNRDAAFLLFRTVEKWAAEKGMEKLHGPLGFSNLDLQGLLVEGFEYLPSIASVYHYPYYASFFEAYGFEKEHDWVEFRLTIDDNVVARANKAAEMLKRRFSIEVKEFTRPDEVLPYRQKIFEILNDAFAELHYVTPLTPELMNLYANKYLKILNPRFIKMTFKNGEPIGFLIGMPSMSAAMKKAGGKLLPFGFIHLLKARKGKNADAVDQLLTGVRKDMQNTGAAVIMQAALQQTMVEHGIRYIETTGIFEDNMAAISNWKNYEYIQHKRRRCYVKNVQNP